MSRPLRRRACARVGICTSLALGGVLAGGCTRPPPEPAGAVLDHLAVGAALPESTFARIVREFSEPDRYFDTDNLISNEATYLDVASSLDSLGLRGGAYIGVGPGQNFSYLARIRPSMAFIIDVRRDNLLQLLWYKGLFHLSRNRVEYLALMLGRAAPELPLAGSSVESNVDSLLAVIDRQPSDPAALARTARRIREYLSALDLGLVPADFDAIERIHRSFVASGLDLRFTTFGRAPRSCYPSYRQLLAARDLTGRAASYLAREEDFRVVKDLHARHRVIPVVGDFAGEHALREIGRYLTAHGERLTAFYTSNVEFYLIGNGTYHRFVENLAALPHDDRSVIIRSIFNRGFGPAPPAARGCSEQSLQRVSTLLNHVAAGLRSYGELVSRHALELR